MNYSLIRLKYIPRYASLIDPNGKQRYIAFSSRDAANSCIHELSRYRSKFGTWPSVDFTQDVCIVRKREMIDKETQKTLKSFLS